MPFSIRPHYRFPVCCPVTYHAGLSKGHRMVWNLSVNGWDLSGDVPLSVRQARTDHPLPEPSHLDNPPDPFQQVERRFFDRHRFAWTAGRAQGRQSREQQLAKGTTP